MSALSSFTTSHVLPLWLTICRNVVHLCLAGLGAQGMMELGAYLCYPMFLGTYNEVSIQFIQGDLSRSVAL